MEPSDSIKLLILLLNNEIIKCLLLANWYFKEISLEIDFSGFKFWFPPYPSKSVPSGGLNDFPIPAVTYKFFLTRYPTFISPTK